MNDETKILVVDDEEVVRLSHARSLRSAHCAVEVAWDAAQALQALERHSFDVILLDLRMPGMSGMSALKMIKQRWPETEVIVVTGYPSVDTAKEAVRLGAYDYLSKPVGPDDIVEATSCAVTQKRWTLRPDRTSQDNGDRSSAGH